MQALAGERYETVQPLVLLSSRPEHFNLDVKSEHAGITCEGGIVSRASSRELVIPWLRQLDEERNTQASRSRANLTL
jgi:hypothetical protein